jgi:hypothetical protein
MAIADGRWRPRVGFITPHPSASPGLLRRLQSEPRGEVAPDWLESSSNRCAHGALTQRLRERRGEASLCDDSSVTESIVAYIPKPLPGDLAILGQSVGPAPLGQGEGQRLLLLPGITRGGLCVR